jgi:hypothetical protein
VSGSLVVYTTIGTSGGGHTIGSKGMTVRFKPGQRVAWCRLNADSHTQLTVDLVADHILWRNICSAVLDGDMFPRLASTPWWLKALFAILVVMPLWRNALLRFMLWIQLQVIFLAHDFHVYHDYVPVIWPWILQPFGGQPPDWARQLQMQSFYVIAKAVMTTAYWTGRLFLGMKGEYVEYTPSRDLRDKKN